MTSIMTLLITTTLIVMVIGTAIAITGILILRSNHGKNTTD